MLHHRGLTKGNHISNFNAAAQQSIMDEDMAIRQNQTLCDGDNVEDHLFHGTKYLGILRYASYEAPQKRKIDKQHPFACHWQVQGERSVQICHTTFETNRCVPNINGTQCDVNDGLQCKKDDIFNCGSKC